MEAKMSYQNDLENEVRHHIRWERWRRLFGNRAANGLERLLAVSHFVKAVQVVTVAQVVTAIATAAMALKAWL